MATLKLQDPARLAKFIEKGWKPCSRCGTLGPPDRQVCIVCAETATGVPEAELLTMLSLQKERADREELAELIADKVAKRL